MEPTSESKSLDIFSAIKKFFTFKKKSMDPIEILPKKILNKIFSYSTGTELLNFSLVSRKWYKFIAKSSSCMDKIKVVLVEPKVGAIHLFTMNDTFSLIQHGRKYMHIELIALEYGLQTHHKLLLAHFQWRSMAIYSHTFKSQMEIINLLGIVEPFVEELTLRNVRHGRSLYQICQSNFQFPRLTKLSLINCYTFIYSDPFRNVKTLKDFNLATDSLPSYIEDSNEQLIERVRAVQRLFLNNPDITYLELFIHQNDFDAMFMDQRFLSRIQFNLHSFYVGKFEQEDDEYINIVQINNFVEFLKSQANTLSVLYLDNWLGNATLEYAVNDMNLKELTIANLEPFGRHNESIGNISLFSNDTIEHLSIWTDSARHHFLSNEVLKVCRGLRVLEIRTINQATLETIIEFNEDLELIVCDFFTAYMPPEKSVLRKLQKMIIKVTCADNFRDLIAYKDCYTSFEEVFLRASKVLRREMNMKSMHFYRGLD